MRQAREQGNSAKSRDLLTTLTLIAISAGMDGWVGGLRSLLQRGLNHAAHSAQQSMSPLAATVWSIAAQSLISVLPVLAIVVLVAIVTHGAQAGWVFAPKALAARLSGFNLTDNLRRLTEPRNFVEALKSLVKIALLAAVLTLIIWHLLPTLIRLPLLSSLSLPRVMLQVLTLFTALMLLGFAAVALFDFWYQRYQGQRSIRMTRDEVKREHREEQGDPHIRARHRELARQLLHDSPLQRTVHATVVLSDPAQTQAVALFRDANNGSRPWLLNKGRGAQALAILSLARERKIKIIEDAQLTMRAFHEVAIDGDLDAELAAQLDRLA
jgi:flagellar biosynthesis protein FlhB